MSRDMRSCSVELGMALATGDDGDSCRVALLPRLDVSVALPILIWILVTLSSSRKIRIPFSSQGAIMKVLVHLLSIFKKSLQYGIRFQK